MKNSIRTLIAFLVLLLSPVGVNAATYYVSKSGSPSNDCNAAQSPSTPKLAIDDALDCFAPYTAGAGANHVVEVSAGVYSEPLFRGLDWPKGSSWNAPFELRAKPGDEVILRPLNSFAVSAIGLDDNSGTYGTNGVPYYVIIKGFKFDGINMAGLGTFLINSYAPFVRIDGNEFINNPCQPISAGKRNIEIINNYFHGGTFECVGGSGGDAGYPIYLGTTGNDALIHNNVMHDIPRFGIHVYGGSTDGIVPACPQNATITNNTIYNFSPIDGDPGIVACGSGHEIYNNIIYNGAGGISTYINGGQTNYHIYNNTIYNMRLFGIAYLSAGITVRNNIVYNPGAAPTEGYFWNLGSNTITTSNNLCGEAGTGCSLVGNPQFVDAGNGDFRLCVGSGNPSASCGSTPSPAIDAGTTVAIVTTDFFGTSRPQPAGGSYDIGAIESGESGSNPPPDPENIVKMSFDEGTGQPQDVSGNANHGTLGTGVTWTTVGCKYNGCLSFAGTGGVTIADSASIDTITHGFTLSAWVKPTSVTNDSIAIVRNPSSKFFLFSSLDGVCGDNRPLGGHGQGGGVFACQAPSLQTGVWSHLSATYNGSQVVFYINGASVATVASTVVIDPTDGTLQIGTSGFNEHFIGLMDEIFVDNYALSQAEIQTRMNTPINDPGPNPPVAGAYGRTGANAVRKMGAGAVAKTQGAIVE